MKKIISAILILSFMLSLTACGAKDTVLPAPEQGNQNTETETKPAIEDPKPDDPSSEGLPIETAPELPAVYTETNLSEILQSDINALCNKYAVSTLLSVWSVEEIETFDIGHGIKIEAFKVGYADALKQVHEYYIFVPAGTADENGKPTSFNYWFQYIDEELKLEELKEFYTKLYNEAYAEYGDLVAIEYELIKNDIKANLEKELGNSLPYLEYCGTFGWDESHITVLNDDKNYYYFVFDNYINSNIELSFGYTGMDSMEKFESAEEAACCRRFGIDDAQTAIVYDPYGFVMAKGNAGLDVSFYGRHDYYEGKSPDLGTDFKAFGTKTIYNVFTKDNQYVKTVAKKDARTFRGLSIGDSKENIFRLYPDIHSEPCERIDETREYYWYNGKSKAEGSTLVIIVENEKVVELHSVYSDAFKSE